MGEEKESLSERINHVALACSADSAVSPWGEVGLAIWPALDALGPLGIPVRASLAAPKMLYSPTEGAGTPPYSSSEWPVR